MSDRILNALLMISSSKLPEPIHEVLELSRLCTEHGRVHFATTRLLEGLTRGVSEVALYGDHALGHELFARATFAEYTALHSPEGVRILNGDQLYKSERPETTRGFVTLTNFSQVNSRLIDLDGVLENGSPLILENLPTDSTSACVYYVRGQSDLPSPLERLALLQAKCTQLQDKGDQLADLWRRSMENSLRQATAATAELHALQSETSSPVTPRRSVEKILELLLPMAYPKVIFEQDSIEELARLEGGPSNLVSVLAAINQSVSEARAKFPITTIKGSNHWLEYRFGAQGRVYFRSDPGSPTYSARVLISHKTEREQKQDVKYMLRKDN